MKRLLILVLVVFVAFAGWRTGDLLSSDALSMAVGMLFGVLAGIPTALLVMAGGRRRDRHEMDDTRFDRQQHVAPYAPQWPVVVLSNGMEQTPPRAAFGQAVPHVGPQSGHVREDWSWAQPARRFRVVGEQDAWIDE